MPRDASSSVRRRRALRLATTVAHVARCVACTCRVVQPRAKLVDPCSENCARITPRFRARSDTRNAGVPTSRGAVAHRAPDAAARHADASHSNVSFDARTARGNARRNRVRCASLTHRHGALPMHVVFCSAPVKAAESLASSLIEERVAACVSVLPGMRSTYRWEGAIEHSEEVLLVIKTSDATLPRLMSRIAELHPYDVPEIVALDVASAHAPYARWVDAETNSAKKR